MFRRNIRDAGRQGVNRPTHGATCNFSSDRMLLHDMLLFRRENWWAKDPAGATAVSLTTNGGAQLPFSKAPIQPPGVLENDWNYSLWWLSCAKICPKYRSLVTVWYRNGSYPQGGFNFRKSDIGSKRCFRPWADPSSPLSFHIAKVIPTPRIRPICPSRSAAFQAELYHFSLLWACLSIFYMNYQAS